MSQPTDTPHSDSSSSESQHSENPISRRLEDLDRRISSTVEGLFRDLNQELRSRVDEVAQWVEGKGAELPTSWLDDLRDLAEAKLEQPATLAATPDSGDRSGDVLQAVATIDAQSDQPGVLRSLVDESAAFAPHCALFLVRAGQVRGWASHGLDADVVEAAQAAASDAPFDDLAEASSAIVLDADQKAELDRLVGGAADEAVLIPLVIRGELVAALYAARETGDGPIAAAALQLLTHGAAMALETLQVSPGQSPTLRLRGELASALPDVADVPAVEEDEPAVEEAVAEETLAEDAAADEPVAEDAVAEDAVAEDAVAEDADAPAVDDAPAVEAASADESAESETPAFAYGVGADEPSEHIELETTAVATGELAAATPTVEPGIEVHDEPPIDQAQSFELGGDIEPVEDVVEPSPVSPFAEPESAAVDAPAVEAPSLEPPPVEAPTFDAPEDDFGSESDLPSDEEIAREAAEPEPALEDTNIWELEEDEEDDEPTAVGAAVSDEPAAPEPAAPEPATPEPPPVEFGAPEPVAPAPMAPEPPAFDSGAIGQETVRLDMTALQDHAAALTESDEDDVGDATAPSLYLSTPPEPAAPPVATEPAVPDVPAAPEVPAAPVAPEVPSAPDVMGAAAELPSPPEAPAAPELSAAVPEAPAAPQLDVPEAPAPVAPEVPATEPAAPAFFEPPASAPAAPQSFAPDGEAAEPEAPASTEVTPPPEPKPEATGGSTEVKPPSDLEGPGLAFAQASQAAAVDDGSEALHEEARRLARLLVSEIKLYNEEIIDEGRRSGNIYERLKDDIDRSRQMYEERIDPRLADQEDYFYQELVQRLAGGDEALLGM